METGVQVGLGDQVVPGFGRAAAPPPRAGSNGNLDTMLKYSKGVRKVPVIVDGDDVTVGWEGNS